jgi:hypothetical protein
MGHIVYEQGESHILSTYFQGGTFTGPFYIGLGVGPFPQAESSTLDDIIEVTGVNYARQQVLRDSSSYGWDLVGDEARSAQVSWNNLDLSTCWTPADYAFLTLSPEGTTGTNILIAAVDLDTSVALEPQRKMRIIFKFRQL